MSITLFRGTGHPGATFKLIDPSTNKVIATATADGNGNVTIPNVPPGRWHEQVSFSLPEAGGPARQVVSQTASPTEFQLQGAYGPVVTDSNGSVWQITVTTAGVLGATKIAN